MQEITASIAIAEDISINAALVVVTLRRDQRMTLKAFLFGKDTNPDLHLSLITNSISPADVDLTSGN